MDEIRKEKEMMARYLREENERHCKFFWNLVFFVIFGILFIISVAV